MRVLGIDLAQESGWAVVECYEGGGRVRRVEGEGKWRGYEGEYWGEVVASGTVEWRGVGVYDSGRKVPVGSEMGRWLVGVRDGVVAVVRGAGEVGLVVVEVPDDFMLGYRVNRGGELRRASSARTVESMLRMSAACLMGVAEAGIGAVECVSPNEWQGAMFRGVPLNGFLAEGVARDTKGMSCAAAWYHLGMRSEAHNETDAALLAVYGWRWRVEQAERAEQMRLWRKR